MSFLFSKAGLIAAFVLAVLVLLVCIIHGCNKFWIKPKPPRRDQITTFGPYKVVKVDSGASLTVLTKDRRGDKRDQEEPVILADVTAPTGSEPMAAESKASLAKLAGDTVTVTRTRGGRRLGATEDEPEVPDDTLGVGGRSPPPLIGVVAGSGGDDLGLAQLRAGLVRCGSEASKEYRAAETEARKAKRGVWKPAEKQHWWKAWRLNRCPACKGRGKEVCALCDGTHVRRDGNPCQLCERAGQMFDCGECRGRAFMLTRRDSPPGVIQARPITAELLREMKEDPDPDDPCPPAADTPKPPVPEPPDDVPELPTKPPVIQSTCEGQP